MSEPTASYKSAARQLIVVLVLLAVLAALAVAYYFLTKPPTLKGEGERDRQFLFAIYGFEGDLLRRPTSVGVDAEGNIFVADTGKRRVVVFDSRGGFLSVYGEAGKAPLKLWTPIDVAVAPDGTSYVIDRAQSKIVIYDPTHKPVKEITTEEPPISATVANDQLFVTTDSGVIIADLDGNALTGYIKRGKKAGEFDRPAGVAVGEDGTLYVADSLNYRVQAIGTDGKPRWQYGKPIPADKAIQYDGEDRKFGLPASIAIDDNGLLYVVDGLNHQVVVLDSADGEFIESIGDQGHADGTFYHPDGIAYADGKIVIADKFNDRVEVFRVPLPPGQAWRGYVPYAIPLILLPLLLILLLRRGRKYVVAPDLIEVLRDDPDASAVTAAMKKAYAAEEVVAAAEGLRDVKLGWVKRDPDAEASTKVAGRFDLVSGQADALAIADALRGRKLLVTDDAATRTAAEALGVPVVTYQEMKAALGSKIESAEAAKDDVA